MKTKQFLALLRFQAMINPFIWIIPLIFGSTLLIIGSSQGRVHQDLSFVLRTPNLFFVGIFGVWVIAAERFQFSSTNTYWYFGTEFLITRAVDRKILFRSRTALFCLLFLIIPLVGVLHSLREPGLKVTEYSNIVQRDCLQNVPGSTLEHDPSGSRFPLIAIPRGNLLIGEWHLWVFVISVFCVQAFVTFLHPYRHRLFVFYGVLIGFIFVPQLIALKDIIAETPSPTEQLFFVFAAHQVFFWFVTVVALILSQLWCERRFAHLEQ